MRGNKPESLVYLVDDEYAVRDSLALLIESAGLTVRSFASALDFLNDYDPLQPGCLLLDVRMPTMSGLELQVELARREIAIPIIFISGHADIPDSAKAFRAGAVDFLEKPISSQTLSTRIREAIDHHVRQQRQTSRKTELARQVEKLSARQREVLDLLVAGERSKQIARQLGIGEKTVAKHRATVLEKMQVDSVVELVRLFADANLAHGIRQASVAQCG